MWVRPSTASYGSFSLDMDRSPGFGSAGTDSCALFRLGFPPAPRLKRLTSPAPATRRTVLQKVRGRTRAVLPQLVDAGFQVLFHSPPGVLFTFPSQYCALSVTEEYLALRGGPRSFPQGFTCPVVLWIPLCPSGFHLRGFHPLWPVFPGPFCYPSGIINAVRTPECTHSGLGSFRFARRYFGNHFCFLLLRLLRCFSSPGSLPYTIRACALFMHGCMRSSHAGFPIQTPADHRVCAPPRSFSQLITSFFGSQCQGILPAPFPA